MSRTIVLAALTFFTAAGVGCRPESRTRNITPPQARQLLDSNHHFIYLDVRTVSEFEEGHTPGAWNVPVMEPGAGGKPMERNPRFLQTVAANFSKEQPIIVGCRSGGRSAIAAELLRDAGYRDVRNLEGGFGGSKDAPGWSQCGYPIEKGSGGARSYEQMSATK